MAKWSRKWLQIENFGLLVTLFGQALCALALTCYSMACAHFWSRSNLHASKSKQAFHHLAHQPNQHQSSDIH